MDKIPKKSRCLNMLKKRLEERKQLENLYRKKHIIDSPCIWYKKEDFIVDSAYYRHCCYNRLYNFYCAIQLNGLIDTKENTSSSVYYRNIEDLKKAKIDFSQSYKIEECEIFYFNPFVAKEVA